MDKLLCTLGMGLLVVFVKMKNWLEAVADLIYGADGFVLILGICVAALVVVGVMMLLTGRRKTA